MACDGTVLIPLPERSMVFGWSPEKRSGESGMRQIFDGELLDRGTNTVPQAGLCRNSPIGD
jgi:hypothetical protein